MMSEQKRNYQKEMERLLASNPSPVPTLLLHSCCAPCSSYVLEYLSQYFEITVLYYNPNIYPEEEYFKRVKEQSRLIETKNQEGTGYPIHFREGTLEPREFYEAVRGLEQIPEGGERCFACFRLRLPCAAQAARKGNFSYLRQRSRSVR